MFIEDDFKKLVGRKNPLVLIWEKSLTFQKVLGFISLSLGLLSLILRLYSDYGIRAVDDTVFVSYLITIIYWMLMVILGIVILGYVILPLIFILFVFPFEDCKQRHKLVEYYNLVKKKFDYPKLEKTVTEITNFHPKGFEKLNKNLNLKNLHEYIGIMLAIGPSISPIFQSYALLSVINKVDEYYCIAHSKIQEKLCDNYPESSGGVLYDQFYFQNFKENGWVKKIFESINTEKKKYKFCLTKKIGRKEFVIIYDIEEMEVKENK